MRKQPVHIGNYIFNAANYLLLSLFAFICLYPLYYIFIYSISIAGEAEKGIVFLPASFNLDNYLTIFQLNNIYNAFAVSALRTVIGTVITIYCCSMFAYVLTKEDLVFRKLIYRMLVVTLYISSGLIPWYLTMKYLGLRNNFFLYILPGAIVGFYVILIKTFIEQLPHALEESAMIDGAGYYKIYSRIIFPLSKPILATIAVFSAVSQWNAWTDNLFLVSTPHLQTLQMVLYNYLNESQSFATKSLQYLTKGDGVKSITPTSIKMTITIVVTIPIFLIYPFMQKYFVKGVMIGAIKG